MAKIIRYFNKNVDNFSDAEIASLLDRLETETTTTDSTTTESTT